MPLRPSAIGTTSVIIEICGLQDTVEASDVAKHLSLPLSDVKEAIKRLQRLGLLQLTDKGLKPTEELSYFGDEQPSEAVVHFHSQILDLTKKYLYEKSMSERYNQSIVFSMSKDDVESMYADLEKAVLNIVNQYAQASKRDCVQVFNMHSFFRRKIRRTINAWTFNFVFFSE